MKGDFAWLLEGLEESIMKGLSRLYLVANLKPRRGINGANLIICKEYSCPTLNYRLWLMKDELGNLNVWAAVEKIAANLD